MVRLGMGDGSMEQFENPLTFVRSLKGAAASVLWAFFFCRRAMTVKELVIWTAWKGDNVIEALHMLVETGWLTSQSSRGPWNLVEGRQFPLRAESDLIGLSPTTTTTSREVLNKSRSVVVEVGETPIKSESETCVGSKNALFEGNMKMCKVYGIGEPMRTQISQMQHVTPDFIEAHVKSLAPGETKGLAIVRIRGDELPALWMEEIDQLGEVNYYAFKQARKKGVSLDEWQNLEEEESEEE